MCYALPIPPPRGNVVGDREEHRSAVAVGPLQARFDRILRTVFAPQVRVSRDVGSARAQRRNSLVYLLARETDHQIERREMLQLIERVLQIALRAFACV